MDGDIQMVESEDREMYRTRLESQSAISAVGAYIYVNKKKSQKIFFFIYMNPKT